MLAEPPGNGAELTQHVDGDALVSIVVERDRSVGRIKLAGDFDLAARRHLADEIKRLFEGERVECIDVDASEVRFIDSAGLNALVAFRAVALGLGIRFQMVGAPPQVRRALTGRPAATRAAGPGPGWG